MFLAGKLITIGCHKQYEASNQMMLYPAGSFGYELAKLNYEIGRFIISIGTELII